jgi:hypothetical protein
MEQEMATRIGAARNFIDTSRISKQINNDLPRKRTQSFSITSAIKNIHNFVVAISESPAPKLGSLYFDLKMSEIAKIDEVDDATIDDLVHFILLSKMDDESFTSALQSGLGRKIETLSEKNKVKLAARVSDIAEHFADKSKLIKLRDHLFSSIWKSHSEHVAEKAKKFALSGGKAFRDALSLLVLYEREEISEVLEGLGAASKSVRAEFMNFVDRNNENINASFREAVTRGLNAKDGETFKNQLKTIEQSLDKKAADALVIHEPRIKEWRERIADIIDEAYVAYPTVFRGVSDVAIDALNELSGILNQRNLEESASVDNRINSEQRSAVLEKCDAIARIECKDADKTQGDIIKRAQSLADEISLSIDPKRRGDNWKKQIGEIIDNWSATHSNGFIGDSSTATEMLKNLSAAVTTCMAPDFFCHSKHIASDPDINSVLKICRDIARIEINHDTGSHLPLKDSSIDGGVENGDTHIKEVKELQRNYIISAKAIAGEIDTAIRLHLETPSFLRTQHLMKIALDTTRMKSAEKPCNDNIGQRQQMKVRSKKNIKSAHVPKENPESDTSLPNIAFEKGKGFTDWSFACNMRINKLAGMKIQRKQLESRKDDLIRQTSNQSLSVLRKNWDLEKLDKEIIEERKMAKNAVNEFIKSKGLIAQEITMSLRKNLDDLVKKKTAFCASKAIKLEAFQSPLQDVEPGQGKSIDNDSDDDNEIMQMHHLIKETELQIAFSEEAITLLNNL